MSNQLTKREKDLGKEKEVAKNTWQQYSIPLEGMYYFLKDLQKPLELKYVLNPEWKTDLIAPMLDKMVEENIAVWDTKAKEE